MFAVDVCDQIPVACQIGKRSDRARLAPKGCGDGEWIDPLTIPPATLIAAPVKLPMMEPADGDGEAVTDLAPHCLLFRELDVVGIRRGTALQTRHG